MQNQYERMELLYGAELVALLHQKRVAIFGIGGVGGNAVEALARSGIGTLDLFDNDRVSLTNLNRQIIALHSTIGRYKVDAAEERIHDIDPEITVNKHRFFYLPGNPESDAVDFSAFDYVVDAIDTVTGKIGIITAAKKAGVPVISCMGCGNRTDPAKLSVCDLFETKNDPLARVMRRELKKRGITRLTVVCSAEPAIPPLRAESAPALPPGKRSVPGSTAFVPPAAGILAASVIVRDLTKFDPGDRRKGGEGSN